MNFQEALEKIEGAQSAGGQLIVRRDGKHIVVGKHVQGALIVEDNDEARAVVAEVTTVSHTKVGLPNEPQPVPEPVPQPQPEPEPAVHTIQVDDSVKTTDKVSGRRGK